MVVYMKVGNVLQCQTSLVFLLQGPPLQNPPNGASKAGLLQDGQRNHRQGKGQGDGRGLQPASLTAQSCFFRVSADPVLAREPDLTVGL